MAERVLVVAVMLALTLAGALLVRTLVHRRLAAVVGHGVPSLLQTRLSATGPTLVYFYGHNCGTCADQARALDELTREVPVHVLSVDATEEPHLAGALGVLRIPATAVVDRGGRVHAVNLGYHPKASLALQLSRL